MRGIPLMVVVLTLTTCVVLADINHFIIKGPEDLRRFDESDLDCDGDEDDDMYDMYDGYDDFGDSCDGAIDRPFDNLMIGDDSSNEMCGDHMEAETLTQMLASWGDLDMLTHGHSPKQIEWEP